MSPRTTGFMALGGSSAGKARHIGSDRPLGAQVGDAVWGIAEHVAALYPDVCAGSADKLLAGEDLEEG